MTELRHGFTCYWRIENFYIIKNDQDCDLLSQTFYVRMLRDSTWHLEVRHSSFKPMEFFLCKEEPQGNSNINLEVSILTSKGWIVFCNGNCKNFKPGEKRGSDKSAVLKKMSLNEILFNDCLTVKVHMSNGATKNRFEQCVMTSKLISGFRIIHKSLLNFNSLKPSDLLNFTEYNNPDIQPCATKNLCTISTQTEDENDNVFNDLEDLLKFFKEKKFRYVVLRTATKDFAVQKALLCARSPVFNAMFQGRMKENVDNVVDINDIDHDTLSLLVQFLHLEPISNLKWTAAAKLYQAADKYQIELLKKKCRYYMTADLSDENICETYEFADAHYDQELQQNAQEYFCKNSKTILRSPEWRDLLFNRGDLAADLLVKLTEHL